MTNTVRADLSRLRVQPLSFHYEPQPDLVSCIVPAHNAQRFVAEAV